MIRLLMVEDDDAQAERMAEMLERYATEHSVPIDVTRDSSALVLMMEKRSFDLVFLDIDLPGINGLEAAHYIRKYDEVVPIIFVTNLAQYAVRGYEVDALDFLVKPVTYGALSMRLDKAQRVLARRTRRSITVSLREGLRVVPLDELVYAEVMRHDLYYHVMGEAEPLRERRTLAALEAELVDAPFVRTGKSCLANMGLIRTVAGDKLVMADGSELYFSRARKKPAMEAITTYLAGGA